MYCLSVNPQVTCHATQHPMASNTLLDFKHFAFIRMGQEALADMRMSPQVASDVTLFTCSPSEELRYEQETANTVEQSNLRTSNFEAVPQLPIGIGFPQRISSLVTLQ